MTTITSRRLTGFLVPMVLVLCSGPFPRAFGSEITKLEARFWNTLYQDLHPDESPHWSELGGRHVWAARNKERLEPILVEIIRGDREAVPWSRALFVAHLVSTQAVCDALHTRMESILKNLTPGDAEPTAKDHASLAGIVSILAEAEDARSVDPLNTLIQSSKYSHAIARKYLRALRKIGDSDSLSALREMPLRKTNKRIDRMAGLTEKVIKARLGGVSVSPNAQMELESLKEKLILAIETKDYEAYVAVLPFGFEAVIGDITESCGFED